MSKIYVFNMISLDGYFTNQDNSLDWHNVDAEFNEFAHEQLSSTETIIFGKVTYEFMADFWPSDFAMEAEPVTAKIMNSKSKVVVSHDNEEPKWSNTTLITGNVKQQILDLKSKSKKDIAIFGSSILCVSLFEMGLIDELRIMVNPIILGKGIPIFKGLSERIKLELVSTRKFESGNVLLTYSVAK